jgi:predicted nicotinamide N-methyase
MNYELELRSVAVGDVSVRLFVPVEESIKRMYGKQKEANSATAFPYWAKLWPSALALSAFIHQNPQYVTGKKVLELAAGLGLPSLLATPHAQSVCCSDYLPEALEVVDRTVAYNSVRNMFTRLLDWHHLPNDLSPEVLLLSDINYDPQEFNVLYRVLAGFLQKKVLILLSTPQRLMAKPFIERLLPWCIRQEEVAVPDQSSHTLTTVMVLEASR